MLHSSATGHRREQTLPEALGLRQAVQPRDDTAGSAAVRQGRPGATQPAEPRSRAQPRCATRIRELTTNAATGDRPRTCSGSRSSGAPTAGRGAHNGCGQSIRRNDGFGDMAPHMHSGRTDLLALCSGVEACAHDQQQPGQVKRQHQAMPGARLTGMRRRASPWPAGTT